MKKYLSILALSTVLAGCAYPLQQRTQAPISLPELAADRTMDLCAIQLKYEIRSKEYNSCYEKNYPSIYETVSRNFFSAQQIQAQRIQAIQAIPPDAPLLQMPLLQMPKTTNCNSTVLGNQIQTNCR